MKRLEFLLLIAFIGAGLVAVGCGGSSTSTTTPQAKVAAAAPAETGAPAAQPAASTEPAATSEPSQAGASETPSAQEASKEQEPRFVPPIRGTANIEILAPKTRVEGDEVVTAIKVRNASTGAIALLRVDETWYDKAGNAIAGDTQRVRKLFLPGEVIDIELRCPKSSKYFSNAFQFTHANGKIDVKTVKSFPKTEEGK